MRPEDWDVVKYFRPLEFPPRPDQMDRSVVFLVDTLRGLFNYPIHVTSAWSPGIGHSKNSQHYAGKAVDFWVEGIRFVDAVNLMESFIASPPQGIGVRGKIGLGIYPHWVHPGFHLDTRGMFARWGAVTRQGRQTYVSWNKAYEEIA